MSYRPPDQRVLRDSDLTSREQWNSLTRRRLLLGLIGLGGIGTFLGLSSAPRLGRRADAQATPGALDSTLRVPTHEWKTDFSKHSVPLIEIRPGGPPRDGIPPIDDPTYVSIAEADSWLEASEPVIALEHRGTAQTQARAYPLQIMVWHEIVNDLLAGDPLLVTFCPLCNTAIAFDRRLPGDDTVYDFGTTGNLRFSDLIMWDRQTESWWQQITGEAIVGELTGSKLTTIPAQLLGWEAFKEAYPEGDVLSNETGFSRPYGRNPYVGYDDIDSSPFLFEGERDDRLAPMERVVGLEIGTEYLAYPLPEPELGDAINDLAGDQAIVVLFAPGSRSALDAADIVESRDVGQVGVFDRVLDGQTLTFRSAGDRQFIDDETETTWDITGRGLTGPLVGRQLTPLPHLVVFWFAWAAAFPETRLWSPEE
jgi:hypothetical protein